MALDLVLLERAAQLAALDSYLREVMGGRGRLVAVSGEAGIGKTTLVERFVAASGGVRVLRGFCDGARPARPMGPLSDVAGELGPTITELMGGTPERLALFSAVRTALGSEPTIFVIEDLHWADESTLDLVRYVGRRIQDVPLLVVTTYRNDEVTGDHPLTAVLGDLASCATTARLHVPALTRGAVEEWLRAAGSTIGVAGLHQRTRGNPFFISEVLAGGGHDVPEGVRDAVLARAARLSTAGRAVLDAAAVSDRGAEPDLVLATAGAAARGLDDALKCGLLATDGHGVFFRHDLVRATIEGSLSTTTRSTLAERALSWLRLHGCTDDRRLATHAAQAGDVEAVLAHAPRAARRAAELGAHTEAVHHLRAAARHRSRLSGVAQAELLDALSYECYLTERAEEAFEYRRIALDLHRAAQDTRSVGESLRWLSRLSWLLGRTADAYRLATESVQILESMPADDELAMAYSNMSQLLMLAGDSRGATAWGQRAMAMAADLGADEVLMHAQNNVGTAIGCAGQLEEGRALLEASLDHALSRDAHEHVARSYNNLASVCVDQHTLDAARGYLTAGIAYCTERDLDTWRLNMEAEAAKCDLAGGDWDAGLSRCSQIMENRSLSAVTRVTALCAAGTISLRRGDPAATTHLDEALALASRARDPQSRVPVALARAEAAWTQDRPDDVQTEIDRAWLLATECDQGRWLGALAWWSMLAGHRRPLPEPVEPYGAMLAGRWQDAADAWERAGDPFWQGLSLAQSDDPGHARQAHALLTSLGATDTLRPVTREWLRRGVPVPRGPRATQRDDVRGLTARELEVTELLCEGMSNAEIARQLVLAEKTVAHHVSAVLRKLGAPSRAGAVAAAHRLGIVASAQATPV